MAPFDPQSRIASLERELAWANLKIQALSEELRQYRVKLLGPRSETLNDLQLELLTDQEPGTTLDEVEAESKRPPLTKVPKRERRPHPGRKHLPENLPRVEEVVPCTEHACRQCGAETAVRTAAGAAEAAGRDEGRFACESRESSEAALPRWP